VWEVLHVLTIGERIKNKRKHLGYTLDDVAKKLGVSRPTVLKYENGIISNIPSDKIEAIAKALETTPAYLMGWEEAEEDELDNQLISMLTKLTPTEAAKVEAFVQGLIANRAE
jgi:repressor LexA